MRTEVYRVHVNAQGRLTLPASARRAMSVQPEDELILRVKPDGLWLQTQTQALQRAQDLFASVAPADVMLSEELLSDRRAEAARE